MPSPWFVHTYVQTTLTNIYVCAHNRQGGCFVKVQPEVRSRTVEQQMTDPDKSQQVRQAAIEEIRAMYPPLLTTSHVAEMLHCTIGDVRDKIRSGDLPAIRWGQQFRFFRDEVLATLEDSGLETD